MRGRPLIPATRALEVAGNAAATVLCADLHGYEGLLEPLRPAEVAQLLGELFEMLSGAVLEHGGQIFALQEAGLLAGFGVGDARCTRAWEAFNAARAMQQRFAPLRAFWQQGHSIDTALGIGIHRGEVAIGVLGLPGHAALMLIGEAAHGAAQLARRARAGEILLSRAARAGAECERAGTPQPALKHLAALQIVGRSAPLEVWCAPLAERLSMRPAWGRGGAH